MATRNLNSIKSTKKLNSLTNKNQNLNKMASKSTATVNSTSKFVTNVLKELNKTEKERQQDSVIEFAENAKIDVQLQISQISTGDLPRLQMQLQKAENDLVRAKTAYEKARFSVADNTATYISNRERALDKVEECESNIEDINRDIANKRAELATFEAILADLS